MNNQLKAAVSTGARAVGAWCSLPTPFSAELVAGLGVDYVVIDMQHGLAAYSDLVAMLQAMAASAVTPMVRIPHRDFALAQRALDAGAQGLICPMVNDAADCAEAVGSCRYPPQGARSYGPIRARLHLGPDPVHANQEILCLVQIETVEAVRNLSEILSFPGIDGVYVGPSDLALTHGLPVGTRSEEMEKLLSKIVAACREAGRIAGVHAFSGAAARRGLERGFTMVTVCSDVISLRAGYLRELAIASQTDPPASDGFY